MFNFYWRTRPYLPYPNPQEWCFRQSIQHPQPSRPTHGKAYRHRATTSNVITSHGAKGEEQGQGFRHFQVDKLRHGTNPVLILARVSESPFTA